jgi:hypothetical protein
LQESDIFIIHALAHANLSFSHAWIVEIKLFPEQVLYPILDAGKMEEQRYLRKNNKMQTMSNLSN